MRDFGSEENRMFERMMSKPNRSGDYYTGNELFDNKVVKPWHEMQPKPHDFEDLYSRDETNLDLKKVQEIKNLPQYQAERTPDAIFLEPALMEGIHNNGWLGEGVNITPASEFDDLVNHVDMVASIPSEGGNNSYLAMDVTTSTDESVYAKKYGYTLQDNKDNSLAKIKYFEDDANPEIKGAIMAPRVVISATGERLKKIREAMLKDRKYALDEDIRQEIIEEVEIQLLNSIRVLLTEHFSRSALSLRGQEPTMSYVDQHRENISKNPKLMENIDQHLKIIEHLKSLKEKSPVAA